MTIKTGIRRALIESIIVVLGFLALLVVYPSTYRSVSRWIDDVTAQLFPGKILDDIVVLDITASDLEKHFGRAHNPLDPKVLHTIISKIASANPKVIGVDIDTSHTVFAQFPKIDGKSRIIWARGATADTAHPGQWILDKVLGGGNEDAQALWGLAFLIEDPDDGKTRSYQLAFEVSPGKQLPTFPSVLAKMYLQSKQLRYRESDPTTPRVIEFRDPQGRASLDVSLVLADPPDGLPWRRYVKDRIVLLGGSYDYADRHQTPLGEMAGVQIVASALETELNGGSRPRLATNWVLICSAIVYFCSGLVIGVISEKMTIPRTLAYVLLIGIPVSVLATLIATGFGAIVPSLGATFLIMVLIQLFGECVLEPLSKKVFRRWMKPAAVGSGAGDPLVASPTPSSLSFYEAEVALRTEPPPAAEKVSPNAVAPDASPPVATSPLEK